MLAIGGDELGNRVDGPGAAALPAFSRIARSQVYPTRPVRIIIGFAPGGQNDLLARPVAQSLSERLGQPFVIENRPGAGSNVATEAVARAAADGYTLLMINTTQAVNISLYDRLNFDFIRDIAPVAGIMLTSLVIVVNPSFPARTTPELIAYAKANPGKINYASSGIGVLNHVAGDLFKTMTGTDVVHVPYRGGAPALIDLLGGQVQMVFATPAASIEYIRAGKLRALAVTAGRRSEALPDVPTVAEAVPGYEASDWYGIGVTKGTPAEIVDRLNNEINSNLVDRKTRARLANLGARRLCFHPPILASSLPMTLKSGAG